MRKLITTFIVLFFAFGAYADQIGNDLSLTAGKTSVEHTDSTKIKSVTKSRFLPTRQRFDRQINQGIYAYKGEVMCGLTVSYGSLASDNSDYYLILDQLKLNGSIIQVNPYIGYFVANNHLLGVRFGYSKIAGGIGNVSLNLGESIDLGDLSFGGIGLQSNNYSFGVFYRAYVPLDKKGRFGLFSEIELAAQSGSQTLSFTKKDVENEDGTITKGGTTNSEADNFRIKLNFSPGLAVYIFPNVCATVSVGLGGLQYNSTKQRNAAGEVIGSRKSSQLRARLNIADIRIGVNVHLWNNKKP
jgi:hypothetical protein